jgi:hypothetical protein
VTFNFCSPKFQSGVELEELISFLREIDENFDAFTNIYSATDDSNKHYSTEGTSQMIYQGQNLAIWISDNRLMDPREVCSFMEVAMSYF